MTFVSVATKALPGHAVSFLGPDQGVHSHSY